MAMPEYCSANRVGIYLSMPMAEMRTDAIVHDAFRQEKAVFVPYIHPSTHPTAHQPKSIMSLLALDSLQEYQSLSRDSWGIPSLPHENMDLRLNCFGGKGLSNEDTNMFDTHDGLDLIIMPGMAFDTNMGRLGHGKGYYDYFLQRYQTSIRRSSGRSMPFLGEHVNYVELIF
jgi:5-formyltetrahydrofolate cyclo-ligase